MFHHPPTPIPISTHPERFRVYWWTFHDSQGIYLGYIMMFTQGQVRKWGVAAPSLSSGYSSPRDCEGIILDIISAPSNLWMFPNYHKV